MTKNILDDKEKAAEASKSMFSQHNSKMATAKAKLVASGLR